MGARFNGLGMQGVDLIGYSAALNSTPFVRLRAWGIYALDLKIHHNPGAT